MYSFMKYQVLTRILELWGKEAPEDQRMLKGFLEFKAEDKYELFIHITICMYIIIISIFTQ